MSETNGPRPGGLNDIYNRRMTDFDPIAPSSKPVSTPLQSIARAIKALSYRDMQRFEEELFETLPKDTMNENIADAILAAADKLEAGE